MTEIIKKCVELGCQESIASCDQEIKDYEDEKFITIMSQRFGKNVEMMDWRIDFFDRCLKTSKFEKQFWVAIDKKNWKLMGLIRIKVRESSDWMMEHMDMGVEKNWMLETDYINSANHLKQALEEMDEVINMIKKVWKL